MKSMPWFRYYSETPNDRKLKWAAKMAGVNKVTINGAWAIVMGLASESPVRGKLLVTFQERFTVTNIAEEFELDVETTKKVIDALIAYGMVATDEQGIFYLPNWQKRQFESDSSTPRVKKHREIKKKPDETPDETFQKRSCNAPETESETETETDLLGKKSTTAPAEISEPIGELGDLSRAFINASGLMPGGDIAEWEVALSRMKKGGVKPEDITTAVKELQSSKKRYTISGPWSIVKAAINVAKRREIKENEQEEVIFSEVY